MLDWLVLELGVQRGARLARDVGLRELAQRLLPSHRLLGRAKGPPASVLGLGLLTPALAPPVVRLLLLLSGHYWLLLSDHLLLALHLPRLLLPKSLGMLRYFGVVLNREGALAALDALEALARLDGSHGLLHWLLNGHVS